MTLKETEEYLLRRIQVQYNYEEARSVARIALQFILKLTNVSYSLSYRNEVPDGAFAQIHRFIDLLQRGEPIQYVTGEAHFMGYDLMVTPDVLIPRRETEELVERIYLENRMYPSRTILDIGTGSGCIAIVLSRLMPDSRVYAMDVSDHALDIAARNAAKFNAGIEFIRGDILTAEALAFDAFDVIVSNPPYVTQKEKAAMHVNVLNYEPHLALFVPNEDPLLFYTKITALARGSLNPGGRLYFEVNEYYAWDVKGLLDHHQFTETEIIRDMQGKERIVKGTWEK
jgi:release factor glutamine methyltransferase